MVFCSGTYTFTRMTKSILITGATGLVGSHLARLLLARGYEKIRALRRANSSMELLGEDADRIDWVDGDILDVDLLAASMKGVDWVFHAAGLISYHPVDRNRLYRVNVEGTANVVNAALEARAGRLLHFSSISVLSRTGKHQRLNEQTPWNPSAYTSLYGLTKHLAEAEVHRGIAEGLEASVIIPSIVLGAGKWKSGSAEIFYRIGRGMPAYPIGANGYVDVRDVALMAIRLMEEPGYQRVIASGHSVSYKDLFTGIATRIGKSPPILRVGPIASELLWRIFVPYRWLTGRLPVINKEMTRAAQCFPEYDNSASLQIRSFGYTPFDRTLDDIAIEYLNAAKKKIYPGISPICRPSFCLNTSPSMG